MHSIWFTYAVTFIQFALDVDLVSIAAKKINKLCGKLHMEKILENLWVLFIAIGGWVANRLTGKIDALEKDKADADTTRESERLNAKLIHELDRRVDTVKHTLVAREEYKLDISTLHSRVNELEQRKADKIKNIRTHQAKEKNGES